jgi:hypothetical protein
MATILPVLIIKVHKKASLAKKTFETIWSEEGWSVRSGELKRGRGHPGRTPGLFKTIAEKLPYECLSALREKIARPINGIYIAHDSMGCARYIGRGNIFQRLSARRRAQRAELKYFSFYVVEDKRHEREIETLLIRAAGFLLEFNDRKKRVGIEPGNIRDFEAGTKFYERQFKRGRKS